MTGMRASRRGFLSRFGVASVGLAAAGLVGCGSSSKKQPPAASAAASPAARPATGAASPAAGAQVKRGGTLQLTRVNDFTLDPLNAPTTTSNNFASLVYNKLVRYDPSPPEVGLSYGAATGDIAANWEQPDPTTYVFHMRPGAQFHNVDPVNGRAATAQDVVASYQAMMASNGQGKVTYGRLVTSIEAPDDQTVTVKLNKVYAPFLAVIGFGQFWYIYPRKIVQPKSQLVDKQIGAGPFQLKDKKDGNYWELSANPAYFEQGVDGKPKPYVSAVHFAVIPEYGQALAQFKGGNLDVLTSVLVDDVPALKQLGASVYDVVDAGAPHIAPQLHGDAPLAKDVRLRQALSMALDRQAILKALNGGKGHLTNIYNKAMPAWYIDPTSSAMGSAADNFKYNPAEAKKLIEAAGTSDIGHYTYPNNSTYFNGFNQLAELVVAQLRQAGFKIELNPVDTATGYMKVGSGAVYGNFDGLLQLENNAYPDPSYDYDIFYRTDGPYKLFAVGDQEMQSGMDALESTLDADKRKQISDGLVKRNGDQMYMISLPVPDYLHAVRSKAHGFVIGGTYENVIFSKQMWLDQ